MAPQTVLIDMTGTGSRNGNGHGIRSQRFSDQVSRTRGHFIGNPADDMGIGEMAFDAGELLVGGELPTRGDGLHAVAGSAEAGRAAEIESERQQQAKGDAGDNACGQDPGRRKTEKSHGSQSLGLVVGCCIPDAGFQDSRAMSM